jgi:hypothetical protein
MNGKIRPAAYILPTLGETYPYPEYKTPETHNRELTYAFWEVGQPASGK